MSKLKSTYSCSLALAMDLVGGKWKLIILWHLTSGTKRFNELQKLLNGITQKMLTQQLRELEETAIITRTVYPVVPPKVEYSLTETGKELIPALLELCSWSKDFAEKNDISVQ